MKNNSNRNLRRRNVLKMLGAAGVAPSFGAALSSLTASSAYGAEDDYKALVCIFLKGGNDGFNMVMPRSGSAYDQYSLARQNLAIAGDEMLPINPNTGDGNDYGLHPSMGKVQGLFENRKLAVVPNVGALVETTTRETYQAGSVPLPPRLFSHNSQIDFWQSMEAYAAMDTGWAGRVADLMEQANSNAAMPMNITLSGANLWQEGVATTAYASTSAGALGFTGFDQTARRNAAMKIYQTGHSHILQRTYGKALSRAVALSDELGSALSSTTAPELEAFSDTSLSDNLRAVSHIIAANEQLGLSRQIFFVGVGGWDTHNDQLPTHSGLLGMLSNAMSEFQAEMELIGLDDKVTTFTASDFGRTLTTNGDGSDHGWGSHHMVMGGGVNGKEFVGQMPSLEIGAEQDAGRGRIIPTTSVDQYCATLASWFGAPENELGRIFPNLGNFDLKNIGLFPG